MDDWVGFDAEPPVYPDANGSEVDDEEDFYGDAEAEAEAGVCMQFARSLTCEWTDFQTHLTGARFRPRRTEAVCGTHPAAANCFCR